MRPYSVCMYCTVEGWPIKIRGKDAGRNLNLCLLRRVGAAGARIFFSPDQSRSDGQTKLIKEKEPRLFSNRTGLVRRQR